MNKEKRITIIVGHYGSGKTEFAVNYALYLKNQGKKTALIDLDIANPYFRSRERRDFLQEKGIKVYGSAYEHEITAEIPAISANIRTPLEDPSCHVVVDAGGNDSGARILNQFKKYFVGDDCQMLCVINRNRPETNTLEGAIAHVTSIECETGLNVSGIINNTHMLRETTIADTLNGHQLCAELSAQMSNIPILFDTCEQQMYEMVKEEAERLQIPLKLFPMQLYMRPTWLDAI